MAYGFTPFLAVFWSLVIALALSFLRPETRLGSPRAALAGAGLAAPLLAVGQRPSVACFWGLMAAATLSAAISDRRLFAALAAGGRGVVSVAATTATAGRIVSVVTLTGLGLKISGIIVSFAGGSLLLTVAYAAVAVWVLGLAVPVTASYIIAAVMIIPALTTVGVSEAAAHMFVFYYAVLSDVSPPTALSPFAAAAITGGNPFRTMMLTWKYCLPAFLVPFMFTLTPEGLGLLLIGEPLGIAWTFLTACVAVAAFAACFGGFLLGPANPLERLLFGLGGLGLLYADPRGDAIGAGFLILGGGLHLLRRRRAARNDV